MDATQGNVPQPYYQDDEITLKELILKIREFSLELWNNKWWIILFGIIISGLFLLKSYREKTTYTAGISFMVTENDNDSQGLNSPFGDLEYGRIENNKITELARSGRIIHEVLLEKALVNSRNDYLANHLINIYGLHEDWSDEPLVDEYKSLHLKDFFFTRDKIEDFSQKELRALSILQQLVAGNNLLGEKGITSIGFNDDTDIFKLNVTALEENLSMRLINVLYEELRTFYIDETIGRPQRTFELIKVQTDSLSNLLGKKEKALAGANDRNRGITSSVPSLGISKLSREVSLLDGEYSESLRNQKKLELLLSQETPEFQIIDRTFFPTKNAPSKIKSIILGGFLGTFLACLYFLGRKVIRDAMDS